MKQKEYDSDREKYIRGLGCQVLRFTNEEIEKNINSVLVNIHDACFPIKTGKLT